MNNLNSNSDLSKAAAAVFDKYAMEYAERFGDTTAYHESFDIFCNAVQKEDAAILELACGPGNITKYLLNKRPDFKIIATDLSPNMLEVAKQLNPGAEFRIMDARDLLMLKRKFDGIVIGFCLPYLSMEETRKLFSDAASILQPNGAVYISTMDDDYSKSGFRKGSKGDEIYMHFYTEQILSELLKSAGMEIKWLQRKVTLDSKDNEETDLLLVAFKSN